MLFRVCLLWNSLPQSVKCSESIVESIVKNEKERSRKYWLFMYFMSLNSKKNKSFIYVTPCGCMKLFWYQCVMPMVVYGCHIDITLVSASTWYIFTIFIVMSGWFLLASAIVQYQRKIKLLNSNRYGVCLCRT